MFELARQNATLVNFNPRRELHGDEPKPAADLKFCANIPSSSLALLDPSLRGFLYWRNNAVQQDLENETSEAPNLRFPKMGGISWNYEIVGATVIIHRGIGEAGQLEKGAIVLPGSTINKFRIEPQEGGTCLLRWRVQCKPDEKQSGKLAFMIGDAFDVSVTPPSDEDPAPALPGSEP